MFTTDPIHTEIGAKCLVPDRVPVRHVPAQPGGHPWCPREKGQRPGRPYPGPRVAFLITKLSTWPPPESPSAAPAPCVPGQEHAFALRSHVPHPALTPRAPATLESRLHGHTAFIRLQALVYVMNVCFPLPTRGISTSAPSSVQPPLGRRPVLETCLHDNTCSGWSSWSSLSRLGLLGSSD